MMLRSRSSILDAERTAFFFNKCFHTASPVWRIRLICIIFMNTQCAPRSIFFSLGAPAFKAHLLIKNFLQGRRRMHALCGEEMLLEWHSEHKGSWLMQKEKQLEIIDGEGLSRTEPPKEDDIVPSDLWCPCGHQCKDCNYYLNSTGINENAEDH